MSVKLTHHEQDDRGSDSELGSMINDQSTLDKTAVKLLLHVFSSELLRTLPFETANLVMLRCGY